MAEKVLTLEIPGKPFGKQRPRFMRSTGHTYTPAETTNYENLVKVLFREKYPEHAPVDCGVKMEVTAVFTVAQSWTKKKKCLAMENKIRPHSYDWDNIGKVISDALNTIAYKDDTQVYSAYVEKQFGEIPCVKVKLTYEDSDGND